MTTLCFRFVATMYDDSFDEYMWEEDPYTELREALAPEYYNLPPEEVEALFESVGLSAEEMEFSLGKALQSIGGVAKTVLPVAGTIVGTAFGGPVGAALGGALGQAAGGAIPGAPSRGAPSRARAAPRGGSPAAAQLLQVLQRPELLQALLGMALGPAGQRNVPVGKTPVPAAAFANLIGSLANQAAAEHHLLVAEADDAEGIPTYLLGDDGTPLVDVALPEQRAARLLGVLESALAEYEAEDAWADDAPYGQEDEDDYFEAVVIEAYEEAAA